GGSWYVEALTDEIERLAREQVEAIGELGGSARAITYMQDEIHRAAYAFQRGVESGERPVVGVNVHVEPEPPPRIARLDYGSLERAQVERAAALRARRDPAAARRALEAVRAAARGSENLLPPLVEAVKAEVTLGEISDALRAEWGTFD